MGTPLELHWFIAEQAQGGGFPYRREGLRLRKNNGGHRGAMVAEELRKPAPLRSVEDPAANPDAMVILIIVINRSVVAKLPNPSLEASTIATLGTRIIAGAGVKKPRMRHFQCRTFGLSVTSPKNLTHC